MEKENVLHGPPSQVPPILCSTGTFMYQRLLKNIHKEVLFLNEVTGQQITYRDFLQCSCRLANSLINYGITTADVASICCENITEYFIPVMSCLYIGVALAPINPAYTESEFFHTFNLVNPDIIFCSVKTVNKILNLKNKYPKIKAIIVINGVQGYSGCWNFKSFVERHSSVVDILNYKPIEVDIENHIAFIMLSSGTTGLPKGVMITHRNVNFKNVAYLNSISSLNLEDESPYAMGFLPFFHAFGLQVVISAMVGGQRIIVLERFEPELYLSCIQKYKIKTLVAAPPIMQFYAKSPLIDKFDLSHVQDVVVGAGPVSRSLEEAVKKRIPLKYIRQGYGMTEATLSLTYIPVNTERHGSCGILHPNLSAVVKHLETGKNLGPNQDGELCFKGGIIMKGYYRNEAANKEIFTEDGFMRSGDIGHYDEDGYFYIVDRLKELIKYKGYQVAPAELEGVLMTNPKIKDAAVVGLPDADAGELPLAFIVKQPGVDLKEEEVIEYIKEFVSATKYLRGGVIFVDEIPRNPSGKILRRELKKRIKSLKSKL